MIDFELTENQKRIKAEAAEFARTRIAPRADAIDKADAVPPDIWQSMGKEPYRYTGMHIPEKYEGSPRPLLDQTIIIDEVTAVGKSPVCTILWQIAGLGTVTIINHASEKLKNQYLPAVARGKTMGSYGLTEPGTGSDAAAITCRAQKVQDGYVINGRKRYISFASEAAYLILFALTNSEPGRRAISAFIFPTNTQGYRVVEKVECLGLRGHHDEELEFKDCWIPQENLIGEEGRGLTYALESLDVTRTTLNAGFIGLAAACLDEAVQQAKVRKTFGQELFRRQAISFPLAEIEAKIEAARLMNYLAAWLHDHGKKHTGETAKAKLLATQVMLEAANMALEVYGGFGCTKKSTVERLYRDAKIWSFAQGSVQMMDYIISRELFGKYEI